MVNNGYDTDSRKYSRSYAEPENNGYNQSTDYQRQNGNGFADSLENQFYFDRPAKTDMNDGYTERGRNYTENNTQRYADYTRQNNDNTTYQGQQKGYTDGKTYDQGEKNDGYYDADPTYYDYKEQERQQNLSARYQKPEPINNGYQKEQMSYTTDDDTAPTPTTMQYSSTETGDNPFEDFHQKGEPIDKQYTINTKGKILIAVYALVIATVFALIILNTRLLKTMNASISVKEMQITKLSMEIDDLQKEYEYVSSDEVIEQKAEEKGMVKA